MQSLRGQEGRRVKRKGAGQLPALLLDQGQLPFLTNKTERVTKKGS